MKNYIEVVKEELESRITFKRIYTPKEFNRIMDNYALLVLVKGEKCTNENVHTAWSIFMNEKDKSNSYLKPFKTLSKEVQDLDTRYRDIIIATTKLLKSRRIK